MILKDRKDVLRVFIYADEEARIRRAVDEYGHDEREAPMILRRLTNEGPTSIRFNIISVGKIDQAII